MRILFATYAEKTHFLGMVPLAWALTTAGHEVRVASQPELTDVITGAGLTAVPVGRNHNLHVVLRQAEAIARRMAPDDGPAVPVGEDEEFDFAENRPEVLTWEYVRNGYANAVPWWFRLVNEPMVNDLVAYTRQWKPDLIIWEPVTYAAPIAATATGTPHARLMWSVDLFTRMRQHFNHHLTQQPPDQQEDVLTQWLTARLNRHGGHYTDTVTTGHFTIDSIPDSLRHDPHLNLNLDLHYLPMRHIPYNGTSVIPPWLRTPPDRPRVALTLGVSSTDRLDGYTIDVQQILTHLADLPIDIIATLPNKQKAKLTHIPDNTHIVEFAPLNILAPTCTAVIHHGGNGTYNTTLTHGIPQLIIPRFFDGEIRAQYLTRQGAGLTLTHEQATGENIRHTLQQLLNNPHHTHQAHKLATEMNQLPTPNQLTTHIEELVLKYRTEAAAARPVGEPHDA